MDWIWLNFSNLPVCRFIHVSKCDLHSWKLNPSQLLCGHDFANHKLLVCQFDVLLELMISKIKQNYLR